MSFLCANVSFIAMFWFPVLYFFLLWYMRSAVKGELQWKRVRRELPLYEGYPLFSVIVACRNEEKKLPLLLRALSNQTLDARYWEVILIDDQSEDQTLLLASTFAKDKNQWQVLSSSGSGKKVAQQTGANVAKGEWLCFLDADMEIGKEWLQAIARSVSSKCDFYLLPVGVKSNVNVLTAFQKIENQFLMSITAASAYLNDPILANGANMVVRKTIFLESWKRRKDAHVSSGDDMYLLWDLKKVDNNRIVFIANQELCALHEPAISIRAFFAQRLRWAGKSASVMDRSAVAAALVLGVVNASVIGVWGAVFLGKMSGVFGIFFHGLKMLAEAFFSQPMRLFLQEKKNRIAFLVYGLLFPLYFLTMPLLAMVFKPKWKNRVVVRS
jgi:poly-beta-1,6-N-acetyl-D-glucosamine synthase